MEHLALYRKYRPKTFEEVIGQSHITKALQNQIALGNLTADVLENNEVTATREVLQGTVNNFEKIICI